MKKRPSAQKINKDKKKSSKKSAKLGKKPIPETPTESTASLAQETPTPDAEITSQIKDTFMTTPSLQDQLKEKDEKIAALTAELQTATSAAKQSDASLKQSRNQTLQYQKRIEQLLRHLTDKDTQRRFSHRSRVQGIAFSPSGKRILSGHGWIQDQQTQRWKGELRLFELETGTQLSVWPQEAYVKNVAYSPDAAQVLSASTDNALRVYDIRSGRLIQEWILDGIAHSAVFSPDGQKILVSSGDNSLKLYDIQTKQELGSFPHKGAVYSAIFSPDGSHFITGSGLKIQETYKGEIRRYNALESQTYEQIASMDGIVLSVSYSSNGRYVMSGGQDGLVRIFSLAERKQILQYPHQDLIYSQAFAPQGRRIAVAANQRVLLYDLKLNLIQTEWLHRDTVRSVVFSPNGSHLLTASHDGFVRLFPIPPVLPDTASRRG